MSTPNQREEAIFQTAIKLPHKDAAAFLYEACGEDAQLRRRIVERLFQAGETTSATPEESPTSPPAAVVGIPFVPEPPGEKPGDTIGRYKLLEKIGEGGFGVVYLAEQKEPLRRRVALKVIKLGMDTRQVVARFEAERQALALMDHPNIAKVLDAGATETGRPFFVMELVRGIKITEYCDQNRLPTRERLDLFMQVCRAVQHAHQQGIIHRDIKPSNILVTVHDGVPVPKVIDFGIAKATQGSLTDKTVYTQFEQFIGTPAYTSPEQAEMSGLDIDSRSDIYSLGVLLYELLTSRTPFDPKELLAAGLYEMRRIIREQEPVRPSARFRTLKADEQTTVAKRHQSEPPKLVHLIRGDLDWIVMKCLEKDRTRRYETVLAVAMDLKRFLAGEPIVARPPSSLYRFGKMARRNKLAFGAATIVAVALGLWVIFNWRVSTLSKFFSGGRVRENQDFQVASNAAWLAYQQGNYTNALAEVMRALNIKTNDPVATRIRDDAQREINRMDVARQQEQEFRRLTNEAGLAIQQGNYSNALAEAMRALDIKINDPVAIKLRDDAQAQLNLATRGKGLDEEHSGSSHLATALGYDTNRLSHIERATLLIGKNVNSKGSYSSVGKLEDIALDLPAGKLVMALVSSGSDPSTATPVPSRHFLAASKWERVIDWDRKTFLNVPRVPKTNWTSGLKEEASTPAGYSSGRSLIGRPLASQTGEPLGQVEDLMVDVPGGRVVFLVVKPVTGPDPDKCLYVLPPTSVRLNTKGDSLVLKASLEHFVAGPHFLKEYWMELLSPELATTVYQHYTEH